MGNKESRWIVEKGKGILNNKRLINLKFIDAKGMELKERLQETKDMNEISEFLVPIMRSFQLEIQINDCDKEENLESLKKHYDIIKSLLADICVNMPENSDEYFKNCRDLLGNVEAFIKGLPNNSTNENCLRLRNSAVAYIDKYLLLLKDINEPNVHAFMSDFSRIAFSSSFRRLQDKAQVFPLEKYDYARTRLTHTLEVTSIAMQLGNLCAQKIFASDNRLKKEFAFLFEKCLNCAAMLHDMGNPPFGHFGEDVIKDFFMEKWDTLEVVDFNRSDINNISRIRLKDFESNANYEQMREDFLSFDGNAQSLRVASKIQQYKVGQSLDLTAAVLGSIIKYPCNSIEGQDKQKFGYFYSESSTVAILEKMQVFQSKYRNPFAIILEAADDISYVTSDLDDAVKKQALSYEMFMHELAEFEKKDNLNKESREFCSNFHKYYSENLKQYGSLPFEYTIQRMTNDLRIRLIKEVVNAFNNNKDVILNSGVYYKTKEDVGGFNIDLHLLNGKENELLDIIPSSQLVSWIKNSLFKKYIYNNVNILKSELEGYQILYYLLEQFTEAVINLDFNMHKDSFVLSDRKKFKKKYFKHEKVFHLISKNFVDVYKEERAAYVTNSMEEIYYRLKLVVDYVSGMTDSYALDVYRTLKGI